MSASDTSLQALASPADSPEVDPTGLPSEFGLPSYSTAVQKNCYERQEIWLQTYAALGKRHQTCRDTGISIWAVQKWQQQDRYGFNQRLQNAHSQYVEQWVSDVIHARIRNPQGNRGSDILVMFEAKKLDPSYREDIKVSVDTSLRDHIQALKALAQLAKAPLPVAEAQVRVLEPGT